MNWQHQIDEPLFPDVIWSQPVNKNGAGKVLMIGGGGGAMANFAAHYQYLGKSGVGTIYLVAPESLRKIAGQIPEITFAPSTPSGSFARKALSEMLELAKNVDSIYLAGDLGKNSETEITLESLAKHTTQLIFLSTHAIESVDLIRNGFLNRDNTVIFLNLNQLQALVKQAALPKPVTNDIGRVQMMEVLTELGTRANAFFVIESDDIWFLHKDQIIDSKTLSFSEENAVVWATQQPEKMLESLVSSCIKTH